MTTAPYLRLLPSPPEPDQEYLLGEAEAWLLDLADRGRRPSQRDLKAVASLATQGGASLEGLLLLVGPLWDRSWPQLLRGCAAALNNKRHALKPPA